MSTTAQPKNQAAFITAAGSPLEVKEAPFPSSIGDDEIVIRNEALGMAIVDFYIQYMGITIKTYPHIGGFDSAGTVVSVGSNFSNTFKAGDRVASFGKAFTTSQASHGAFQLFTINDAESVFKIPESLDFIKAVVLPTSLATAASSLFQEKRMGLTPPITENTPEKKGETIFVYGGSTSVALCAIQLSISAGYSVATVASSKHHSFLSSLGVEYLFDRSDNEDELLKKITEELKDKNVIGAFETVGGIAGPQQTPLVFTAKLAGNLGVNKVISVNPRAGRPDGIPEQVEIVGCTSTEIYTDTPALRTKIFGEWAPEALQNGSLKPFPEPLVFGKGLESVNGAIARVKQGVSGQRVVVQL